MFFALIFLFITYIFKNAFSIYFFTDDFFFLKISRISNLSQFINFFNPIRQYSYKPIATEVYYFIIHHLNYNLFLSHLIVFIFFFIGLFYLYKIILLLTKEKLLGYLATIFYGINSVHVFQLYSFNTFQEIAVFSFLSISLYKLLIKKDFQAVLFFVLALLSKETAILFVPFLIIFKFFFQKKIIWRRLLPYIILGSIFTFIYWYSLKYVTSLDNYKIALKPKLIANNFLWYFLWSLGFPNFTSDYFTSIFKLPIPEFYKLLKNFPSIKLYFQLLIGYLITFTGTIFYYLIKFKKERVKLISIIFLLLSFFFIFIGPIAFFPHKWMVRLTMPLIFIVFLQAYFIICFLKSDKILKVLAFILIIFYIILNVQSTSIYESSSTYLFESKVSKNVSSALIQNRNEINKSNYVFFKDSDIKNFNPWGESKKLKVTLSDQNFIDLFFPNKNIKAIYEFENKNIPKNSFIIKSLNLLNQ